MCGRLVARVDGQRIEDELPGRQGRLAFVYLVVNRQRAVTRDELVDALWHEPPSGDALSPLLSKLRRLVPLEGRSEIQLALPTEAWIDLEAATEALHRAQAGVARTSWTEAWGPARVAQHVATRGFLPGEDDLPWVEEVRRRVEKLHVNALELVARACLEIGGGELDTAERSARTLVRSSPYRETGYVLLMEALAAHGNRAEALLVYDDLRRRLRDDLGAAPSAATQELHLRLLG